MDTNKNTNHTDEELDEELDEGAEGGTDQGTDEGDAGSGSEGKKGGREEKPAKTFTQDQVSRMMAREKNQGRNAALRELGIDPKDKKMAAMLKAFVESQKTDDQKASEQAAAEQEKIRAAEEKAAASEAKAEAVLAGATKQYVDDVVTLVLAKVSSTEDADVRSVVEELKTKYPVWFAAKEDAEEEEEKKSAGKKGTGSSIKKSGKDDKGGKKGEQGMGARLAAQRKSGTKKTSYWS